MTVAPFRPTVVVVGAAARDLDPTDPRGWRLGGGVMYGGLAVARLGVPTAVLVGVDAAAAEAEELGLLRAAGAEVRLVPLERGPIFVNLETPTGRAQTGFSASDPIDPRHLPDAWRGAPGWLLAPVADELPETWAAAVAAEGLVATAWQGLLRDVVPGELVHHRPPAPSAIVARSDIVGVGSDDLTRGVVIDDLCRLMHPGATLAFTQGARGGIAIEVGDGRPRSMARWPGVPTAGIVDPTGAGDVFLAGLLAARVEARLVGGRRDARLDFRLAATVASLVLEGPGLTGVPDRAAIKRRLRESAAGR
ncbi:MAG TPA: PfkB family carbohydrate kinase [Candidatus Limnocylindrales bacterium]